VQLQLHARRAGRTRSRKGRARGDRGGVPAPSSFADRDAQDRCRTRRSDLPVSRSARERSEGLSVVKTREWSSVFYPIRFCETNPFLATPFGDPGDIDVYSQRWRDAAPSAAGSLEALELVLGLVECPLYCGLIAGELGESVRFVRVMDEG
jgi:hypothetical protein